ncbi:RagB/SusD family nutrient uptake outer membrane protein [Aestuariibaculum sp. YM273]|uniref:RagB/SusD family nutrient uptake outer membrane protein n=1 Tax=Aestuariibaculum sp. YM273 TaxID=3070659 RepID=UPI0027DB226C|nr:RagB/SusD family nutrient uptake outer membrane protein [Aestuariibaculum sp. YM273]WMI64142.1 RagB/SusD family nutrient uptake outer membrane protein [Aestuariibaculum sp. YM273]
MKKYFIYLGAIIAGLNITSCDDYVDIRTEGKLIPEETINYRYLLNDTYTFDKSYGIVDVMSDDIVIRNDHAQYFEDYYGTSAYYRPFKEVYKWADSVYYTGESDYDLNSMYSALYKANVVITEVMDSKNGTETEKLAIKGEALVNRAYVFLTMVNIFGKAYDINTSTSDLGIPMFTEPIVEGDIYRSTVDEVYAQIISDLTEAVNAGLPSVQTGRNVGFASKSAAHALLARTYLYMGNYEQAIINAEASLGFQNTLLNLEDYIGVSDYSFPRRFENPEVILSKQSTSTYMYSPVFLSLDDELLNSFDENDLRYQLFTRSVADITWGQLTEGRAYCGEFLTGEARNAGPSVPEMMLIKAECLARNNEASLAMETVNALREKRFQAENYEALTAADAEYALVKVLEERRRELMVRGGFRWFDLKRLNKDPRFAKTITHKYLDETFTLEPEGERYQMPFASKLFDYAPNLEQN